MSEPHNPARGVIPASLVVLFSMMMAGILVKQTKLDPIRPAEREAAIEVPQWEDPFLSTAGQYDHWLRAMIDQRSLPAWEVPRTIADLRREIEGMTAPERGGAAAKTLTIVAVLTASGLSHNAIEVRRRQRVALSTAMVSHRFAPKDPGKLNFLAAVLPGAGPGAKALVIPYEWFTRQDSRETRLVLWLQGSELERSGFGYRSAFELLINAVLPDTIRTRPPAQERVKVEERQVRVQVIGPAASGELRSLAQAGTGRTADYAKYRRVSGNRESTLNQIVSAAVMQPDSGTGSPGDATPVEAATGAPDRSQIWRQFVAEANEVIDLAAERYSSQRMQKLLLSYLDEAPDRARQEALGRCIDVLLHDSGSNERAVRSLRAVQQFSKVALAPAGRSDPIGQFKSCLAALEIKDSDSLWESRVTEFIRDKTSVMIAVRNHHNQSELTQTDRLILLAEGYLDAGWNETYQLSAEMTQTLARVCQSANGFAQHRVDLEQQLRAALPYVVDSDEDWARHLADLYVARCEGAETWDPVSEVVAEESREESPGTVELIIGIAEFEFYSPLATMPNRVLFNVNTGSVKPTGEYLDVRHFERVIATDDVVLEALFTELKKRSIDICSATIPLILQGDSVYGRDSIHAAITAAGCGEKEPRIEQHFYFSHAEGSSQAQGPGDRDSRGQSSALDASLLAGKLPGDPGELREGNFPAGPHQLDYISRLAEQFSQRKIQVIGIMGGDIYDKQLIIQALRQRIRTAVIFTTDTDAIYEYPKFFRFNRNLLVASSYGLSVPSKLERTKSDSGCVAVGEERFISRDNYQSSFYVAAQAMLAACHVKPPSGLYEVGNSAMLRISAGDPTFDSHVPRDSHHRYLRVAFLLMPMLILFGYAQRGVATLRPLTDDSFKLQRLVYRVTAAVSLATLLVMAWVLFNWDSTAREPLYLFEGISSVPTLVMRLNAMLLAVFLIAYLFARLKINNSALERYFQLPPYSENLRKGRLPWIWKWSVDLYALRHRAMRLSDPAWQPPSASALWMEYTRLGSTPARLFRSIAFAAPVIALTFYFVFWVQPQPPLTRDPSNAYLVVTSFSFIASILSVAMAGDALKLCTAFVGYLQYDFFHWDKRPNRDSYTGLDDYVSNRLCSIEMIMRRTETLRLVIILPAIVLFLQIFARSTLFEGWVWTNASIMIYVYFIGYVFLRSIRLQQAANAARAGILVDLERRKSVLRKDEGWDKMSLQIEDTIKYIQSIRRGAFQPMFDHPIFQAIAWPSTALGLLALLQALL